MSKQVMTRADQEALEALKASYPIEATFNRVLLPRLSLVSQDVTEGKGKAMKVVTEAGTFLTEVQDEKDKTVWNKEEIGDEVEVIILYERKQLKFYDGENYTSSPVYDSDDQVIPLFYDKKEIDRGTPAELKSRKQYQGVSAKGKPISKLEDNKILYVLYEGKVYQMNLRGTSMFAFKTWKKEVTPNTVVTILNSEPKENGATAWNQMTFVEKRELNGKELQEVLSKVNEIKDGIETERAFYASLDAGAQKANEDFDKIDKKSGFN